jgi:hypothetical protein
MESRFGHDFSRVRVHDDRRAAASADAVGAQAYTVGSHVVFGAGRHSDGRAREHLLRHELAHVVQQRDAASHGPIDIVPADHPSEREAEAATLGSPARARPRAGRSRLLQRYSHQDCSQQDRLNHIYDADNLARIQVRDAIAAVNAPQISPATQALFVKYFMTATPNTAAIADVFRSVKAGFDGDGYTYECDENCSPGNMAWAMPGLHVHLCMNNLRGRANDCIARAIVHEFMHKYAWMVGHGWWFGTAYCYNGCDNAGCPPNLSPDEALSNPYSFAGFAREV